MLSDNAVSKTARWYHQIDGPEAERLLRTLGQEGSFLARPSTSTSGDYTLSVRRHEEVTHIKIQSNGEFYDLYGGDKFASLSELVEHYMKKQSPLKETNGSVIELKYPFLNDDSLDTAHLSTSWFHKHITGPVAEQMLRDKGKLGSFLVRSSMQQPNSFVLCVLVEGQVLHIRIFYNKETKQYDIGGGQPFSTLNELIEHYKKTPMVDKSGTVVYLKQAFNATRVAASQISNRVAELDRGESGNTSKTGFWEEFEELQSEADSNKLTRDEGTKPDNKSKNRFKNILPFDDTRVKLNKDNPKLSTDDYINANYIQMEIGHPCSRKYIATQGPLSSTEGDFWRMVWQEDARVIVMTTKEIERGKNKCVRYWSSQSEPVKEVAVQNGKFLIRHLSETLVTNQYTTTKLEVSRLDLDGNSVEESRHVVHYQYLGWPDHNVPSDPSGVLNLLERVHEGDDCCQKPLVVHCSAGIGRTGSVIIIDMLISAIRMAGLECDIDVKRTTSHVRQQRSGMVQTESQYKFIYKAVQHYIDIQKQRREADQITGGHDYTNLTGNGLHFEEHTLVSPSRAQRAVVHS